MIMFVLDLLGLVTGGIRFFICWMAEGIKKDRSSPKRKRAWKNVWTHFGVTFVFFYLAFHL